jgi:hypothetical protein
MRNRFGRALCGLAASAAVTTAIGMVGAGVASAGTHHAKPNATAACSDNCLDVNSFELGHGTIMNAYIHGDTGLGGKVGQKVNLKFASDSHPNEDFTDYAVSNGTQETVADFCNAWPAPQSFNPLSYVCQNYFDDVVFEWSWSPFGNESGLCVGVAKAVDGENVTLQDCGDSDNTLWIADAALGESAGAHISARPAGITAAECATTDVSNYCPWVNGGDTNFSHPLVLTVNAGSSHPANQLKIEEENLLTGGDAADQQEFTVDSGEE